MTEDTKEDAAHSLLRHGEETDSDWQGRGANVPGPARLQCELMIRRTMPYYHHRDNTNGKDHECRAKLTPSQTTPSAPGPLSEV